MKVYFEQSGGLVGMGAHASVDSDSLQAEEASKLQGLINDANFFDLPTQLPAPSHGADYLEYKITIEANNDKKHSIKTTELTMPPNVGPLIRYLKQKAVKDTLR
jgi:hypothetical protein